LIPLSASGTYDSNPLNLHFSFRLNDGFSYSGSFAQFGFFVSGMLLVYCFSFLRNIVILFPSVVKFVVSTSIFLIRIAFSSYAGFGISSSYYLIITCNFVGFCHFALIDFPGVGF